jgi:hypothetical protein
MYYNDFDKKELDEDTWTTNETYSAWMYGGFITLVIIWTIGLIHTVFYIVDFFKWVISNG